MTLQRRAPALVPTQSPRRYKLGETYDAGQSQSDVHVTRHFSPLYRNSDSTVHHLPAVPLHDYTQSASFCDWISIYQDHGPGLPVLADGCYMVFDSDGTHSSTTLKKLKIEGSYETGVFIRCDGSTVHFSGNVSKFGRSDNVEGYSFGDCLERINALLTRLGLPRFSAGQRGEVNTPNGWRSQWTGARITRIDLTQNFSAGSKEQAYFFMRFLASQQASRLKTGTHGEGETVDFGRGSRRVYSKAYLKGPELYKHANKKPSIETDFSKPFDPYITQLAEFCDSIGLVRFETTYKSTFLIDNGFNFLGAFNMPKLEIDFKERQSVFTRANAEFDDLSQLDKYTLAVYRMWQAGDDITTKFKKSQFYKHRATLLPFGVDIAVKSNVVQFQPRTRVIKLEPVTMPDWYRLPHHNLISLAA